MLSSLRESDTFIPRAPVKGFRLRGIVAERETTFHLPLGTYRLGSSDANELPVQEPCVSRHHAVLRATSRGLEVEDQGSTNGTWIGDRRIEHVVVDAGEVLRFGPVSLQVEPLDEEETELGIELSPGADDSASKPPRDRNEATDLYGSPDLIVIERCVTLLADGDLEGTLRAAARRLRAEGACAIEWRRDADPTVVAGWGRIGEIPNPSALYRLIDRRGLSPAGGATRIFGGELRLVGAVRTGRRGAGVGLLLWDVAESHHLSVPLLRILVRLIDGRRPPGAAAGGDPTSRRPDPELVFPAGYRRGTSPAAEALYRQMRILLRGDIPVLIRGETGVGKEQVARILHESSARREGPFLAINCSAVPADLLEAELFGIGRAVATGVEARAGIFELARGGTLLLDEIGDMPLVLQAKLLRVLQENEVHPVGGKPRRIDVRILAATNADLAAMMAGGRLRRDLYYRLAGYSLEVPPLRRCSKDVPGLVEHFLRVFSFEIGVPVRGLTLKALRLLTRYPWPGNVRELANEIRRMVYQATGGDVLDSNALSPVIRQRIPPECDSELTGDPADESLTLAPRVQAFEAELIREALARAGGNQTRSAKLLGLSRNGLLKKMKRLGVRAPRPSR